MWHVAHYHVIDALITCRCGIYQGSLYDQSEQICLSFQVKRCFFLTDLKVKLHLFLGFIFLLRSLRSYPNLKCSYKFSFAPIPLTGLAWAVFFSYILPCICILFYPVTLQKNIVNLYEILKSLTKCICSLIQVETFRIQRLKSVVHHFHVKLTCLNGYACRKINCMQISVGN